MLRPKAELFKLLLLFCIFIVQVKIWYRNGKNNYLDGNRDNAAREPKSHAMWCALKFRKWIYLYSLYAPINEAASRRRSFISVETRWTISQFFMATLPLHRKTIHVDDRFFTVHSSYVASAFSCSARINNKTYNLCKAYSLTKEEFVDSRRLTFAQQSVTEESRSDMTLAFRRKSKQTNEKKIIGPWFFFFILLCLCRHCQDICVLFYVYKRRAVPLASSSLATFHPAREDLAISSSPSSHFCGA